MEKQTVRVTIGGMDYVLRSDKDAEYMQALATDLHTQMMQLLHSNHRISATQAAVLCALEAMDANNDARQTAEHLRTKIQDYLEDAAQTKKEASLAQHEVDLLQRELAELKRKKAAAAERTPRAKKEPPNP